MVEQNRPRAARLHALAELHIGRYRTQPHHHASRTGGVTDDLMNSISGGDVHVSIVIPGAVDISCHFRTTAADGGHSESRVVEGIVELCGGPYAQTGI